MVDLTGIEPVTFFLTWKMRYLCAINRCNLYPAQPRYDSTQTRTGSCVLGERRFILLNYEVIKYSIFKPLAGIEPASAHYESVVLPLNYKGISCKSPRQDLNLQSSPYRGVAFPLGHEGLSASDRIRTCIIPFRRRKPRPARLRKQSDPGEIRTRYSSVTGWRM